MTYRITENYSYRQSQRVCAKGERESDWGVVPRLRAHLVCGKITRTTRIWNDRRANTQYFRLPSCHPLNEKDL